MTAGGTTVLLLLVCLGLAADVLHQLSNNHPALREFLKRQAECEPQCLSAAVPELCHMDCIHPACAARIKATGKFEDPTDTAHARFYATFRQCAAADFVQMRGKDAKKDLDSL